MKYKPSYESKIDAYNQAIDFLDTQECSYDDDGDYKAGRLWLKNNLIKMKESFILRNK